ncbi:MAG: EamA family transporter [Lachnospiraceae bacterium]|nr:EamA family transporter [Lachnospiraceae bacterium]
MWNMIWPMILIVVSNCFYNICTKSTPENVNTFGALTVTYLIGAMLSSILFVCSAGPAGTIMEIKQVNWTSLVLGLSIVGLEAGYVFLYRAGWKVSNGALTANICLAIALIVIGFLLYKETISPRQILGIVVCGIGLFLINH